MFLLVWFIFSLFVCVVSNVLFAFCFRYIHLCLSYVFSLLGMSRHIKNHMNRATMTQSLPEGLGEQRFKAFWPPLLPGFPMIPLLPGFHWVLETKRNWDSIHGQHSGPPAQLFDWDSIHGQISIAVHWKAPYWVIYAVVIHKSTNIQGMQHARCGQ